MNRLPQEIDRLADAEMMSPVIRVELNYRTAVFFRFSDAHSSCLEFNVLKGLNAQARSPPEVHVPERQPKVQNKDKCMISFKCFARDVFPKCQYSFLLAQMSDDSGLGPSHDDFDPSE